jgi:uncharacterized integral membrane protein
MGPASSHREESPFDRALSSFWGGADGAFRPEDQCEGSAGILLYAAQLGQTCTVSDSITSRSLERVKQLSPRAWIMIVVAVLALIFIFQNTGDARVHVLFWDSKLPLWLWLLLLFASGFVVGSLFPWFRRRKKGSSDQAAPAE